MRLLTLPPLVLLLLLVFLWLILLVLLLWFALRPRRLEATYETTDAAPKNPSETRRKSAPPEDEASSPACRTVVVRQAPAKLEEGARDDAFDGYNRPTDRRDDFDF